VLRPGLCTIITAGKSNARKVGMENACVAA
jgi:hypothetical protein